MSPEPPHIAEGDFYLSDSSCCTSCGVPHFDAPTLFGYFDKVKKTHCYWKKQPETPTEIQQAILVLNGQELGCHRYRGTDPEILRQIPLDDCDNRPLIQIHPPTTPTSHLTFGSLNEGPNLLTKLREWLHLKH
jgi:hypothetical protein